MYHAIARQIIVPGSPNVVHWKALLLSILNPNRILSITFGSAVSDPNARVHVEALIWEEVCIGSKSKFGKMVQFFQDIPLIFIRLYQRGTLGHMQKEF